MKVFKERFDINIKEFEDMPVDQTVMDEIKQLILNDLESYFNMPTHLIYNVNNLFNVRSKIVLKYLDSIHTLKDIINMAVTSLGNTKLGNRILVFNLSCYFNCYGLKTLNCSCTKNCYAGKLEFRQFKKNIRNNIFYLYCKLTKNFKLFEIGIKTATNKALEDKNTALFELSAVRFNEVGEIEDSLDLEFLRVFLKIFEGIIKTSWTYSTSPFIKSNMIEGCTINKSVGFNYDLIDIESNNSYSCIIESPKDIKAIYEKFHPYFKISLCSGTCRVCRKCTLKNNIVVFILHGNKSHEVLMDEILEAEGILKSLEAVNNE